MEQKILLYFLNFFLLFKLCYMAKSANNLVLKQTVIIFRHGDRTQIPFQECPVGDCDPDIIGQLTEKGLKRAHKLGEFLKDRYGKLLDESCPKIPINAYSSYLNRTKLSLRQVLSAIYPDKNVTWDNKAALSNCDLIFVNILNDSNRLVFPNKSPLYLDELSKVLKQKDVISRINKYHPLLKQLAEVSGENFTDIRNLFGLQSFIDSESSIGNPLPKWVEYFEKDIVKGAKLIYDLYSYTDTLKRLNGGMMIKQILDNVEVLKSREVENFKLNLYSAHDINIDGVLQSLEIRSRTRSYYTSSVIFEIWKNKNKNNYFIKILYYDGRKSDSPNPLMNLNLEGCETFCQDRRFRKILANHIPTGFEFGNI